MKKLNKNQSGFGMIEIILIIIVIAALGVGSWLIYKHHQNNSTAAAINESINPPFNCENATSNVQINAFVTAYQKKKSASLKFQASYGTTVADSYQTCHSLTIKNGQIYNTEYSWADATSYSPLKKTTCSLSADGTDSPMDIVNCGPNDTFNLSLTTQPLPNQ